MRDCRRIRGTGVVMASMVMTVSTVSMVALGGCAIGGDQTTTTAASLGDGGTTGQSTNTTEGATSGASSTTVGATMGATEGVDSTGSDTNPGSESTTAPPLGCDEDPTACTAWLLPSGAGQWMPEALDAGSPLAPTDVVRAACDIEGELEGIVLTDSRVHVVDLAARQWVRSENKSDLLPDLGNDEIRGAYSIPSYWGADPNEESVTFLSATTVYSYTYLIDTQTFVFDSSMAMFGDSWSSPSAPAPAAIRASWLDVANGPGWFSADIMQLCGVAGEPGPYVGFVAGTDVHVTDAGYCFEFDTPVPLMDFTPYGLPGAPGAGDIGASLYNETMGLWVFRGE